MFNTQPDYKPYTDIVGHINSNYKNNEHWLGWKILKPLLNFKHINEETCANLAKLDETTSKMADTITTEINDFKEETQF